ncbi:MAG TPA: type VI secretion system membrane subunit TssM, partial [Blastocatellia bacterium]
MSQQWSTLKSYLGLSALVSIYGIASLLVLYAGPSLGLGLSAQIIIIVLLLLTWPFAILISRLARRRRERKGAARASTAAPAGSTNGKSNGKPAKQYPELNRNTEEAVQWLRSTRLGGKKSGDAIYGLPWFVIAGPPRSGKTSLLLSAGLDFHALPSQRRLEHNLLRPTSNLEYRVTDSAVWLDTAGRYHTEDQTEGHDGGEWSGLIDTIKRHRKARPIDGLVLAVSAAHVLGCSDSEIEGEAKVLRARLDEAVASTHARFPVYLVFTNVDAIEGFDDFFLPFDSGERSQVWGATVALDQSESAHALFDVEFDYLYESLMERRLVRLSDPAEPAEQLRIFNFPLFFGAARDKFGLFTASLFRPNPFSENPWLRGFYFTSSSGATNTTHDKHVGGNGTTPSDDRDGDTARISGEGFFTRRLLGDVILRDKDLVASFHASHQHPHRVRNSLLAAAVGLVVVFTVGMFVSFATNKFLIAEAADRGQNVVEISQRDNGGDPSKKGSAESRTELEAVNTLRTLLAKLDDYDRNSPPLYLRFGLYCGNAVNERLREIYFDSIDQRFFKNTGAALERDLQSFVDAGPQSGPGVSSSNTAAPTAASAEVNSDLGHYYDLLKAYLMASSMADKSEWAFLNTQLADYWVRSAPPEFENLARQQLEFYAKQADTPAAPRWPVNDALVAKARGKLQAYPAIDRFYKTITTEINEQVQPVTLDSVVPPQGRGWVTGSASVPGSFTIEGYKEHMLKAFRSASGEIDKDDWVMGTSARSESTDINKLQAKYFTEYSAQWRQFLRDTHVAKFNSKDDIREGLKVMSAANSPVGLVIEKVAEETNLTGNRAGGFFGWLRGLFGSNRSATGVGGTPVDKEFAPVIQFVAGEDEKAGPGLVQYRNELQSLRDQLEPPAGDQLAQTNHTLLTGKEDALFQKTQQDVGRLTESLGTPAAKDAAGLLMQPLRNIRAVETAGTFEQIDQIWCNQIYPRAKALESGYPFTDS